MAAQPKTTYLVRIFGSEPNLFNFARSFVRCGALVFQRRYVIFISRDTRHGAVVATAGFARPAADL